MTVAASAGAQIDFSIMSVGRRSTTVTVGKFTSTYYHYGFSSSASVGSVTKPSLETAGNTSHSFSQLEHVSYTTYAGSDAAYDTVGLNFRLTGTVADTDEAGFKTLVMTNTSTGAQSKLARSARAGYSTQIGSNWDWSYTNNLLSSAYTNSHLVTVELRSDHGV